MPLVREIQRRGTTEAAEADDQHARAAELALGLRRRRPRARFAARNACSRLAASARARARAAAPRDRRAPRRRASRARAASATSAGRCSAPCSTSNAPPAFKCFARFGKQHAVRIEPVGAAIESEPRLERQAPRRCRPCARKADCSRSGRNAPRESRRTNATRANEQWDPASPARSSRSPAPARCASGLTSSAVIRTSRRLCLIASAMTPLPVPTSSTVGARSDEQRASAASTSSSVSGRGISTSGHTSSGNEKNSRLPTI